MKALIFAVMIAVTAAIVPAHAEEQKSCQLVEVASLAMTPISDNRFTVPMAVAGKNFNMLLDTGDDLSMLTDRSAAELGLTVTHTYPNGWGGMYVEPTGLTVTDYTQAEGIQLGNIKGTGKFVFGIRPEATTPGYDGSLGIAFMRDYDLDFDFANKKFNIFSKDHCPGAVVYWTKGPVAAVPVELRGSGVTFGYFLNVTLNGKPLDAGMDTSAPHSFMDWDQAKFLFGFDENTPGIQAINIGGGPDRIVYRYTFNALSFGGVTINNVVVEMQPSNVSAMSNNHRYPGLIVGADVLSRLHLYIAIAEKKLYITAASAH